MEEPEAIAHPDSFDCTKDQVLTFESIVKGCYANPERGKYQNIPGSGKYVYSSKTLEQILNLPPKRTIA